MGRNKYRLFPTTMGVDPNTGGPIARGKIIKPEAPAATEAPEAPAKTDVSVSGAKRTIKNRRANMESILEELDN